MSRVTLRVIGEPTPRPADPLELEMWELYEKLKREHGTQRAIDVIATVFLNAALREMPRPWLIGNLLDLIDRLQQMDALDKPSEGRA
jgi:hypothetical protein